MDINTIREITNAALPYDVKEGLILAVLADDPNVIPNMIQMLSQERDNQARLIKGLNAQLSRAIVYIQLFCIWTTKINDLIR